MFVLQYLHLPQKIIHEKNGIKSFQPKEVLQLGHLDLPNKTEYNVVLSIFSLNLQIRTEPKDQKTAHKIKTKILKITISLIPKIQIININYYINILQF